MANTQPVNSLGRTSRRMAMGMNRKPLHAAAPRILQEIVLCARRAAQADCCAACENILAAVNPSYEARRIAKLRA